MNIAATLVVNCISKLIECTKTLAKPFTRDFSKGFVQYTFFFKMGAKMVNIAISLASALILFLFISSFSIAKSHKQKGFSKLVSSFFLGLETVVGLILQYRRGNFLSHTLDLFGRFGETFKLMILTQKIIFTCDPYNIDYILIQGFEDFDIGPLRQQLFTPVMPHSIFNLDGQAWRKIRRLLRTQFSQDRSITDLERQEHHFQNMVTLISTQKGPVDLQEMFIRLLTDTTSEFALGFSLGSLDPAQSLENRDMEEALRDCKETIARNGIIGPLHRFAYKTRWLHSCRLINSYIEVFARKAMDTRASVSKEKNGVLGYKFVQQLARQTDNFEELRDQTTTLVFAGVDPVASLLSSTFWLLSRNPQVLEKLHCSIMGRFGEDPPTYDQLKELVYLRYVLNEGLFTPPVLMFGSIKSAKEVC
jgi:cytochrome P450